MKRRLAAAVVFGSLVASCTSEPPSGSSRPPAVNLLSPAPTPTVETTANECNVGMVRADHVEPSGLLDVLGSYAPGWLPIGFGLLIGFQGTGRDMQNGSGAIWTNSTCHQVHLEFIPDAAGRESARLAGRWELIGEGTCTFAPLVDVRCFDYHAQDNGGILNLKIVGLDRSDAERIVAGIPING